MERGPPGTHKKGNVGHGGMVIEMDVCPRRTGDPAKNWPGRKRWPRGMSIPEEPRATGQHSAQAYGYPGNAHAGWAEAAAEGVTGAGTEAGLLAEVSSPPLRQGKMSRLVCWWLFFGLGSLLARQAEAPSPVEPPERSRPYAVLRGQNLGERPRAGWRRVDGTWGRRGRGGPGVQVRPP